MYMQKLKMPLSWLIGFKVVKVNNEMDVQFNSATR